jgi:hypothetical protein
MTVGHDLALQEDFVACASLTQAVPLRNTGAYPFSAEEIERVYKNQ